MHISSLHYIFVQGLANIWRNKMFSLASIATMTACIFLFGVFYSIGTNFSGMVDKVEEGVAVTVYFEEGLSQDEIEEIGREIAARPEVASYHYVSAEEAWETFQKDYLAGHEDAAESFVNDNPLSNAANYEVYLKDVSKQKKLVNYLQSLNGVGEIHQSEDAVKIMMNFNSLLRVISTIVVGILVLVSVFLISNTVTVGISVRKEEIAIMKLIGAKDSFVRAPFVVEGIVIGLVGAMIPLGLLYFLYSAIIDYVAHRFSALQNFFAFVPLESVFHILIPVSLALGVGIGFIGSRFTLRKHLKV